MEGTPRCLWWVGGWVGGWAVPYVVVRGHGTGSSHSGAEEYPREKHEQPKVVHVYITADAIHASTRNI